jgi:hypothetical protein
LAPPQLFYSSGVISKHLISKHLISKPPPQLFYSINLFISGEFPISKIKTNTSFVSLFESIFEFLLHIYELRKWAISSKLLIREK